MYNTSTYVINMFLLIDGSSKLHNTNWPTLIFFFYIKHQNKATKQKKNQDTTQGKLNRQNNQQWEKA